MLIWFLPILDAAAQEGGFDAHGFRLAAADADVRDPLTFLRPGRQESLDLSFGLAGEYAQAPLVFEPPSGGSEVLLQDLVAVNVAAGFAPVRPLRLGIEVPAVLSSANPASGLSNQPTTLGDLRGTLLASVVQPGEDGGVGLGVVGHVGLPTGDPELWLGEGGLSGGGALVGTVEGGALTVSLQVGARFTPKQEPGARPVPTRGGDVGEAALAIGVKASERFGVSAEAHGDFALDPVVRRAIGVPAEALLSGRYVHAPTGVFVMAGVGTGLTRGAGASPLRAILGAGFGLGGSAADSDGDGVVNRHDRCPEALEIVNGLDDEDGCPDELPSLSITAGTSSDEERARAKLTVTRPNGTMERAVGDLSLQAVPGARLLAAAQLGSCRLGSLEIEIGALDGQAYEVPVKRVAGPVRVKVSDAAGRPLRGATVRYIVDDPICGSNGSELVDGEGVHEVGVGEHTVLITAPGYDIAQQQFRVRPGEETTLQAVLSPTQVRREGGRLVFTAPLSFERRSTTLTPGTEALFSQIASVMFTDDVKVKVVGYQDADGGGRQLAWDRAGVVRAALEEIGVPRSMIATHGAAGPPAEVDGHVEVRVVP